MCFDSGHIVGGTSRRQLLSRHHVRENHGDDRTLWGKLFAQEKNLTTAAIARFNLFLHSASDFQVVRSDTLRQPAFFSGDNLATFDCVIANPPFSPGRRIASHQSEAYPQCPLNRTPPTVLPAVSDGGTSRAISTLEALAY
jgi:type I restriction-modification system DNA methylase subunit